MISVEKYGSYCMVFGEIVLGNGSKISFRLYSSDAAIKTTFAPISNGFDVDQKSICYVKLV